MQLDIRETVQLLSTPKGDMLIDLIARVHPDMYVIEEVSVEPEVTILFVEGWVITARHYGDSYCGASARRADKASKYFAMTDGGWIKLP